MEFGTNSMEGMELKQEVMERQATINIGTTGHVANGKSKLVEALTGVRTTRHKQELQRNITIKLGYANAKIYRCVSCPRPVCYKSCGSNSKPPVCELHEDQPMELVRHVSFVDCPGHDILVATMLNGAAVMDAALLLVACNEACPQPQMIEHLMALNIMGLEKILVLQNKVDLVKPEDARRHKEKIKKEISGTVARDAPILPISVQYRINIEYVLDYIVNGIEAPKRDLTSPLKMMVVRSFDVNKPGCEWQDLKGGVIGGSIIQGVLRVGQPVEIRPGILYQDEEGRTRCRPVVTRVISLFAEQKELEFAIPGGLIGVGTTLDPHVTRGDNLIGEVVGEPGSLPEAYRKITVEFRLVKRVVGGNEVKKLNKTERVMLNVGSKTVFGVVCDMVGKNVAVLELNRPVCASLKDKVSLSMKFNRSWRLAGYGVIVAGAQD